MGGNIKLGGFLVLVSFYWVVWFMAYAPEFLPIRRIGVHMKN